MPAIHINNVDIQVYEQQYTSPTLHVQNTDGKIYHAIVIPQGGELFDASETLVYSNAADKLLDSNGAINECQDVTLDAGMYRVELRGGAGGKQSRCNQGTGTTRFVGNTVSQIFKLPTKTTVYAFRGGDGNDSDVVTKHQIPGGGASGVDSMLVIGDRVVRANGAPGTRCMSVTLIPYPAGGYGVGSRCQGGGGGVYTKEDINNAGMGYIISYRDGATECCAAGGGGANVSGGGIGGGEATKSNPELKVTAGTNATSDGGGNGGDAENLRGDSRTQNTARGGIGGKNVYWQCVGHTAVSYGGGGGGATCALSYTTDSPDGTRTYSDCADGGNGASGSTGTSDTSYIKIYKIG